MKTVLVTGGNRGIGREACRQLVGAGYRVVLTARDEASGQAAAAEIGDASRVQFVRLDVTDAASVAAAVTAVRGTVGALDGLLNNAAIALDGLDREVARRTLDTNVRGVITVTDAMLPLMSPRSRIANVSSGLGTLSRVSSDLRSRYVASDVSRGQLEALMLEFEEAVGGGRHVDEGWPDSAYSVSKISLNAFTRILHRELTEAGRKVFVNAVSPGWVRTDMGGDTAPRSVADGASGVVWAVTAPVAGGQSLRDGRVVRW